ncbi:MAG: hypothetical protein KKD21_12380, partial [Proteobacteria bacterium]|nr:hypothetical protein [Pseudomonadota bacterium]
MKREIKKYLFDIMVSINSINDYIGTTKNFFEYYRIKSKRNYFSIYSKNVSEIFKPDTHRNPNCKSNKAWQPQQRDSRT